MAEPRIWHTSHGSGSHGVCLVSAPAHAKEMAMTKITPITRDGAINLIRDLKSTVEENLSVLAHILMHERFDAGAAQVRAEELQREVDALAAQVQELEERNDVQAGRLLMHSLGLRMSDNAAREAVNFMKVSRRLPTAGELEQGDRMARYQRIAVGARNRIRDGHNKLAEMLLTTMIEEMEHEQNERAGHTDAPRGWGWTGDCD